jgi:hypothetical protein
LDLVRASAVAALMNLTQHWCSGVPLASLKAGFHPRQTAVWKKSAVEQSSAENFWPRRSCCDGGRGQPGALLLKLAIVQWLISVVVEVVPLQCSVLYLRPTD